MRKKILIIEDEVDLVNTLSSLLQASGFVPIRALDGATGLAKAKVDKPDLIILDMKMPVMDGFELSKRLKGDSDTRHIPLIVISGMANDDLQLMVSDIKAADYITKPFDTVGLIKKIKKALK